MKLKNKIIDIMHNLSQHYNPKKYWKRREIVTNPNIKRSKLIKYLHLYYIKKCDGYNCASLGTIVDGGAHFSSVPNLPHGIKGIVIGHNVTVGKNATIYQRVTIEQGKINRPTTIGDNCIIGCGAFIKASVIIGDNVKIGANAVVTHDIPSNCVVGGVPAIIIKD